MEKWKITMLAGIVLLGCLASGVVWALAPEAWGDASKHQVQFVTVEGGVELEVLDWGGAGRPVVLLAGYNTAHVYDEFAEKLAETNRVYGITRRGFGRSSRPESGYTAPQSAEDVVRVLESLHLDAPVIAGHSFGGQDLSNVGRMYPNRVAGLVYLNSAEDPTLVWSDYGLAVSPSQHESILKALPVGMRDRPTPAGKSFQAYRELQRQLGFAFPESELRQLYITNPDGTMGRYPAGRVRDLIFEGRQKPDYAAIQAPILALFATPRALEEQMKRYAPKNTAEREAIEHDRAVALAIQRKHLRDLQAGSPGAKIIELRGANFYVFLSNEADVLRELRDFMATLR